MRERKKEEKRSLDLISALSQLMILGAAAQAWEGHVFMGRFSPP